MSQTFSPKAIVRCPFCYSATSPVHVGHGVMIHEECGQYFRVVFANGKRTGKKLSEIVKENVKWGRGGN
jgi:hypothetical protein